VAMTKKNKDYFEHDSDWI